MIAVTLASFFIIAGCAFALVAAIGVVRMPDIYCRMHAATKAGAFGLALALIGLCIAAPEVRIIIQSFLIVLFFYLTAPLAAHMIGRVAMNRNAKFWTPDETLSRNATKRPEADKETR